MLFCTVGADTTDTEGLTEGAGGKMGDVADFFRNVVDKGGQYLNKVYDFAADVTAHNPMTIAPATKPIASNGLRDVSDFMQNEIVNKSDLRGAQLETFLGGLPIVGGVIRGLEGASQLEDLYNRTGKVPAYPTLNSTGASGLGSTLGQLTRKIENGSNSLHEFYSGEPEVDPSNLERMNRYMSENWNVRRGAI